MMVGWDYDIESYKNYFFLSMGPYNSDKTFSYEISFRRDDRLALMEALLWLREKDGTMWGFNNIGYDYPVLHLLLGILENDNGRTSAIELAGILQEKTHDIIVLTDMRTEKYKHQVWESDHFVKQGDLLLINHFDNENRRTSLKQLMFNMRLPKLQELPVKPGKALTEEEADAVSDYCVNGDLVATKEFHRKCISAIERREKYSKKFHVNMRNYSDSRIGVSVVQHMLEERFGKGVCFTWNGKKKKAKQTHYTGGIDMSDVVFDWIEFNSPEFSSILEYLKSRTIYEYDERSLLSGIVESSVGDVAKYISHETKFYKKASKNDVSRLKSLNCIFNGLTVNFGLGGIHGALDKTIIRTGLIDGEVIKSYEYDVNAYYGSLAVANRLHPAHLPEGFCDVWGDLIVIKATSEDVEEVAMVKLAINSIFGMLGAEHGFLRDLLCFLSVTINGQLLLCKLAEMLYEDVPSMRVYQMNTDGVAFSCIEEEVCLAEGVLKKWEEYTKLSLGVTEYKNVWSLNVNNYIAEKTGGKFKKKGGSFIYGDLDWAKDFSNFASKKAIFEKLTKDIPIKDSLMRNEDPYDFMLFANIGNSDSLVSVVDLMDIDDESIPESYRAIDLSDRFMIEKVGFDGFKKGIDAVSLSGELPTTTIKSFQPLAMAIGIPKGKAKFVRAAFEVYTMCADEGLSEFPVTVKVNKQQNKCRYAVVKGGDSFFKIMKPLPGKKLERHSAVRSGWGLRSFNDMPDEFDMSCIDYKFYEEEALKVTSEFEICDDKNSNGGRRVRKRTRKKVFNDLIERKPS